MISEVSADSVQTNLGEDLLAIEAQDLRPYLAG